MQGHGGQTATKIKVARQWKYLYLAVDKGGLTVDFLLIAKRDLAAARRYLERAINLQGAPETITINKSGTNTAAIKSANDDSCLNMAMLNKSEIRCQLAELA